MRKKPKVAIIRGPGLSKWEMGHYEPLTQWFDIFAVGTTKPINDISGIKFPIKQLLCPAQYVAGWPKMMPVMLQLTGDTQWLVGFDQAVAGVDLVHSAETWSGYTWQAILAKRKGLVRAVSMTAYENIPYLMDEYPKRYHIKRAVMREADQLMPANELARQCLVLEGANPKKITVVPQSVDTRLFRPGKKTTDFVVLSAGRMVWEKGWYDIVAAADYVGRRNRKIHFRCLGAGPELEKLRQLAAREGLEGVVDFVGLLPYRHMPEEFGRANLFLYPSLPTPVWNAQFCGVLIEAMAAGLPVVGTLSGGTRDNTVGKGGGIFVQPQHFSGLGEAILKLARDKKLYHQIAVRNREVAVKKYDGNVVARTIKAAWEAALEIAGK